MMETYKVDAQTIRDAIEVRKTKLSPIYRKYAAEKVAGTTTEPYYIYHEKAQEAARAETKRQYEEYKVKRKPGETMLQYQKRMGYK